jgi:hypothetical protein
MYLYRLQIKFDYKKNNMIKIFQDLGSQRVFMMSCHVVHWKSANVSKKCVTSIFKVKEYTMQKQEPVWSH